MDAKKEEEKKIEDSIAPKIPKITPEQIASRKRAHEMKIVKFKARGEF